MKRWFAVIAVLFSILGLIGLELHFIRLKDLSITTKVLLLIVLNLNIIALLTLSFFVVKSLLKLYLERRQKVLGAKFKIKIVTIFVILISIPALLLFIGASGLLSNYIDRWFSPRFTEPIVNSVSLAKGIYEMEKEQTLKVARMALLNGAVPEGYRVYRINDRDNPSQAVSDALKGEEGTEVISLDDGDIIRAAIPVFKKGIVKEVIVVETIIPAHLTARVNKIKDFYEDYAKLETFRQPLKLNYLIFLGFFTLLVIFTALWVSLRIARGITEPVQILANAMKEVASGNLNVSLKTGRDDEIGFLINSFNSMVQDIKSGKEILQSAYAESDRRRLCMENILENIRSGVISLDSDGNVVTINKVALSILNLSPALVLGRHYKELLALIGSKSIEEMLTGIKLKTLERIEREIEATINGRKMVLRVTIMGLRDSDSNYMGLLVVFDDLTDIIKAQKAIAWQEVARRIAHEIKNPLTPIKLSTERMLRKWENNDADFNEVFKKSTKTIIREVESLKKLVDEFSRFGKMPEINKTPTDLKAIIEDVINLYRAYRNFKLNVRMPQDLPLIDLDGEQFKRVLINLIDNAFQALGKGGTIDVNVDYNLDLNRIYIDVADDGPGIKEEDKDKLFLPYFSTKKEGTGLGLAIANKVVTEHRGYISVRDNQPKGTVFTIELPIKETV